MATIALQSPLRGKVRTDVTLAPYTSWHVGGKAKRCYWPADLSDLVMFLQTYPDEENYLWLGLGSNVLIRDGGFQGTVIFTQGCLSETTELADGTLRVEAGITCAKLAKYGAKKGFEAAAFFAGVPGTVGGALAMNAGAFGGETWKHVVAVDVIDNKGNIQKQPFDQFQIAYREVQRLPNTWFVAGYFRFERGGSDQAQQQIKQLLKKRSETQPIGTFNCGSVFRNPPGDHAARLIESCGLKGKRMGGAHISMKHANFIINDNNATAEEIEQLIMLITEEVFKKTGIKLQKEVHIVGDHSACSTGPLSERN